ncbi:MAG: hypothetical protein V4531_03695 [Actinomycetota bacterium]
MPTTWLPLSLAAELQDSMLSSAALLRESYPQTRRTDCPASIIEA